MTVAGHAGRALRIAAGSGFAALLVFAPFNFGSTRAGGPDLVALIVFFATGLWALSLLFPGRRPWVPFLAAGAAGLVMLAALPWFLGLVHPTSVSSFTQAHFARVADRWPVSIVWRTPANTLALMLALSVSFIALIDLARSRAWALAFAVTLVTTAVGVAVLAMLQNATGASGIYWRDDGRMPGSFWGVFYHHTSAGAFLNLAWPLAAALTVLGWFRSRRTGWTRVLVPMGAAATLILLAAHTTHVSRFPQLAALLVAPGLIFGINHWIRLRGHTDSKRRPARLRIWAFGAAGAALLLVVIVASGRTQTIAARWQLLFSGPRAAATVSPGTFIPEAQWAGLVRDDLFIPNTSASGLFGDRGEGWRTALRAIAERPLFGHGPANWTGAASRHSADPFVRTFFLYLQFTHQDALQTAVEWGIPAAVGWWTLLLGGLVTVVRGPRWRSPEHRVIALAAACGLGAVLLQAQLDFPLQMPAIAYNSVVLAALAWAAAGPASSARGASTAFLSPS